MSMNNPCIFCNGEKVPAEESAGGGIRTIMSMISSLQSAFGFSDGPDESNYIQLQEGNLLCFQNSSGEYTDLGIRIEYCPLCGRKLSKEEET